MENAESKTDTWQQEQDTIPQARLINLSQALVELLFRQSLPLGT